MYSTSLPRPAIFAGLGKTISNTILFKNIQEYSKKIVSILKISRSSIEEIQPKNDISTLSRPRKILGIQSIYAHLFHQ